MNKRIEKLIMEAVNFRLDTDSNAYEAKICPEDLEYLAESIVRKCAKVAWYHTPDSEELEYSHLIKDKILEHFGVEE